MQVPSFICAFIDALWIMAVIKMMNCLGGFFYKRMEGKTVLDVRSLRDNTAVHTSPLPLHQVPCFSLNCFVLFPKENVCRHPHL